MSKVLLIGDPHLKITKFQLSLDFLKWIQSIVVQEKPDIVINLGDTFDTHSVVRSEVMSEFMNSVYDITKHSDYFYIVGNHDMYKPNDSKYHALSHLKGKIQNFTIVDDIVHLDDTMTLVSYKHDDALFPTETKRICIAHQTFKGASFGEIVSYSGVDQDSISADIILSGHIHKRQKCGDKVYYVGTPFAQSASDVDMIKGVTLFDTNTYEQRFIESPFPKWRSLSFDISSDLSAHQIGMELSEICSKSKDHLIVDISGPKAEIVSYLESKSHKDILKSGASIRIRSKFTDSNRIQKKINSFSVEGAMSDYIDRFYDGALDKKLLLNKTLELLNQ